MLLRHDFVTLYANGIRYLEKAPLLYWSMAASMRLFGAPPPPPASRSPSASSPSPCSRSPSPAAPSAPPRRPLRRPHHPLLLRHLHLFPHQHPRRPRLPLAHRRPLLLTSSPSSEAIPQPSLLGFAAACALNVLTKGLIGIVFPIVIVALHLLLTRGLRGTLARLRQLHLLRPHSPSSSLIAAPWHILAALANPGQGQPGGSPTRRPLARPAAHRRQRPRLAWFYFINEQRPPLPQPPRPPRLRHRPPRALLGPHLRLAHALVRLSLPAPSPARGRPWTLTYAPADQLSNPAQSLPPTPDPPPPRPLGRPPPPLLLLLHPPGVLRPPRAPAHDPPARRLLRRRATEPAAFTRRRAARASPHPPRPRTLAAAPASSSFLRTRAPAPDTDLASPPPAEPRRLRPLLRPLPRPQRPRHGPFPPAARPHRRRPLRRPTRHYLLRRRHQPHAGTLALAAGAFLFLVAAHAGLVTFAPTLTSAQLAHAIGPQLHAGRPDLLAIHGEYEAGSTLGFYLRRPGLPDQTSTIIRRPLLQPLVRLLLPRRPPPLRNPPIHCPEVVSTPTHLPLAGPPRPRPPPAPAPRPHLPHRRRRRQTNPLQPTQPLTPLPS